MLNDIWVGFSLVYISEEKGRTSADILLFKTHVQTAVQMSENLKFWGGTKIQEWKNTKSCQSDINAAVISYFHFIFHNFVLGHHHGFGNCGGLGQRKIYPWSRREVDKWAREEGKEKFVIPTAPHTSLPTLRTLSQPSTNQASNYNVKWRHRKPGLSNDPFHNNACTAG